MPLDLLVHLSAILCPTPPFSPPTCLLLVYLYSVSVLCLLHACSHLSNSILSEFSCSKKVSPRAFSFCSKLYITADMLLPCAKISNNLLVFPTTPPDYFILS